MSIDVASMYLWSCGASVALTLAVLFWCCGPMDWVKTKYGNLRHWLWRKGYIEAREVTLPVETFPPITLANPAYALARRQLSQAAVHRLHAPITPLAGSGIIWVDVNGIQHEHTSMNVNVEILFIGFGATDDAQRFGDYLNPAWNPSGYLRFEENDIKVVVVNTGQGTRVFVPGVGAQWRSLVELSSLAGDRFEQVTSFDLTLDGIRQGIRSATLDYGISDRATHDVVGVDPARIPVGVAMGAKRIVVPESPHVLRKPMRTIAID